MTKCITCKRNATQKRLLDDNNVCSDCKVPVVIPVTQIDESKCMSEITFSEFKSWISSELYGIVLPIIAKELEPKFKVIETLQKENKDLTQKLNDTKSELEKSITEQSKLVKKNTEKGDRTKTTSDNNLKYLVNLDRNIRRQNVVIFGVPENTDLVIGEKTASTDSEKRNLLFDHMGCSNHLTILDSFRLGKGGSDKPRPLKVTFLSKEMADNVLWKKAKLNELKAEQTNIYLKPDKSKGEQSEFQRMGKKKEALLKDYPTVEGEIPRVILKKGSLLVDGKLTASMSRCKRFFEVGACQRSILSKSLFLECQWQNDFIKIKIYTKLSSNKF